MLVSKLGHGAKKVGTKWEWSKNHVGPVVGKVVGSAESRGDLGCAGFVSVQQHQAKRDSLMGARQLLSQPTPIVESVAHTGAQFNSSAIRKQSAAVFADDDSAPAVEDSDGMTERGSDRIPQGNVWATMLCNKIAPHTIALPTVLVKQNYVYPVPSKPPAYQGY